MEFGSVYDLAEYYDKLLRMVPYPNRTIIEKPRRENFSSHEKFGRALDKWEEAEKEAKEVFLSKKMEYNKLVGEIHSEFKRKLLEYLEVSKHPRANRLYDMAWDRGHSSGYCEVAQIAEDLSELIK